MSRRPKLVEVGRTRPFVERAQGVGELRLDPETTREWHASEV
jgi:hypothetical protein